MGLPDAPSLSASCTDSRARGGCQCRAQWSGGRPGAPSWRGDGGRGTDPEGGRRHSRRIRIGAGSRRPPCRLHGGWSGRRTKGRAAAPSSRARRPVRRRAACGGAGGSAPHIAGPVTDMTSRPCTPRKPRRRISRWTELNRVSTTPAVRSAVGRANAAGEIHDGSRATACSPGLHIVRARDFARRHTGVVPRSS